VVSTSTARRLAALLRSYCALYGALGAKPAAQEVIGVVVACFWLMLNNVCDFVIGENAGGGDQQPSEASEQRKR
jgi:hypothetical protein